MSDPRLTTRWRRLRAQILAREPTCRACKHSPATTVDHIVPIRQGGPPYDPTNLQPLCKVCHLAKTALTRTHSERAAIRYKEEQRAEKANRPPPLTRDAARAQLEGTDRWAAALKDGRS